MKKTVKIFLSCLLICLCTLAVQAADLKFTPREGGKYIYCNNHEFIYPSDLADITNEHPRFLMSNEDMTADSYTLFASHINHTEQKNSWGAIAGKGFDIELDVMFSAKEDSVIKLTSLGFEVPDNVKFYANKEELTAEKEWGCFTAWASYLGTRISQLDSGEKYEPVPFEPTELELKAGETVWLSKFIPNYRSVPLWRPVHLMTDFQIVSGKCDINIAAVKSRGTVGNRTYVSPNAEFGAFVPQYEMKGIANSKNEVDAYLELEIPGYMFEGKLPVTVYNRYAPNGKTVTTWYTNLNPSADIWNKDNLAEDCMLAFEYKDPSKLKYYGTSAKNKDDVWHFDTSHALVWNYNKELGVPKSKFDPNFELSGNIPEEYCNVLGNYGVLQNYHITVTNSGYSDKWLNYTLNTAANNLIILRDENGEIMSGYPLTKGTVGVKETDTMASVKVAAQQTVKFTLTVVLTTNHIGGMENSFVVTDRPSPVNTYNSNYVYNVKDSSFTGREYIRFEDGKLYVSEDNRTWQEQWIDEEVRDMFKKSGNELQLTWTGNGYIATNNQYSGIPFYIVRDYYREVWGLDENFGYKWKTDYGISPTASSGAFGIYYIKAGSNFYSTDGENWLILGGNMNLPCYNYGRFAASATGGRICLSEDGLNFTQVLYEGKEPLYIDALGDVYYYIEGKNIYVSSEGIYWKRVTSPKKINKIGRCGNSIVVNDDVLIEIPFLNKNNPVIKYSGEYLAFDEPPIELDGKLWIKLRSFAELSGASLEWKREKNSAEITLGGIKKIFTDGENAVIYNGSMYIKADEQEDFKIEIAN